MTYLANTDGELLLTIGTRLYRFIWDPLTVDQSILSNLTSRETQNLDILEPMCLKGLKLLGFTWRAWFCRPRSSTILWRPSNSWCEVCRAVSNCFDLFWLSMSWSMRVWCSAKVEVSLDSSSVTMLARFPNSSFCDARAVSISTNFCFRAFSESTEQVSWVLTSFWKGVAERENEKGLKQWCKEVMAVLRHSNRTRPTTGCLWSGCTFEWLITTRKHTCQNSLALRTNN